MKKTKSAPLLSRKERERQAREKDILKAAQELFTLKGYHKTTLEEIAQQAEFGKGTIYNYFDSKEDLFYGIIDQLTDETLAIARSSFTGSEGNAREKLTVYARAVISHVRLNADLFNLILREIDHLESEEYEAKLKHLWSRARRVWAIIAETIQGEILAGKMRPFDAFALATLFDSLLRVYTANQFGRFRSGEFSKIDDAAELIVSIFFDGVADGKSTG